MAVFAPISGSFSHYGRSTSVVAGARLSSLLLAARWVDPALGFAVSFLF